MVVEIKGKDEKTVYAVGIPCDTLKCGHCGFPLMEGQRYWMLDDPYICLVHTTCLQFFKYDKKCRSKDGEGRKEAIELFNEDEETMARYMERPHFNTRIPTIVKDAWIRLFNLIISIRRNYDPKQFDTRSKQ